MTESLPRYERAYQTENANTTVPTYKIKYVTEEDTPRRHGAQHCGANGHKWRLASVETVTGRWQGVAEVYVQERCALCLLWRNVYKGRGEDVEVKNIEYVGGRAGRDPRSNDECADGAD